MLKRIFAAFLTIAFCIVCAGCGFHPRSAAEYPQSLRTLYFSSVKPYSSFSTQFQAALKSVNVTFVKSNKEAPYSLVITRDHFSYSRPDIVDATLPTTINFSQVVIASIEDNKTHKKILSKSFSSAESLTLNPNQIYTNNQNDLIREELNHELVSIVYYWFTSQHTQDALGHAAHPKTTRHTS